MPSTMGTGTTTDRTTAVGYVVVSGCTVSVG